MSKPKVYISGPITHGDRDHNFQQAADCHRRFLLMGYAPLNPMLSMKLPGAFEIPHRTWIDADLPWVECAEAVFRLPGTSLGADEECEHAKDLGIPVFTDETALVEYLRGRM